MENLVKMVEQYMLEAQEALAVPQFHPRLTSTVVVQYYKRTLTQLGKEDSYTLIILL